MANRGENLMKKCQNAVLVSLTAMFCLFSTAFAAAQTTISETVVNFGDVVENTTSATRTVIFKNTGTSSITINAISVTAPSPYAIATSTCGATLAAGKSCTVGLTLSPTTLGAQPAATLTIATTAPIDGTQTASLSGTGITPTWLSSSSLSFIAVAGEASDPKTVTLYNNQLTPLIIHSISVPTNYAVTGGTCPSPSGTLPARSSCTISITLTPPSSSIGVLPGGLLTINTDALDTPNTASLSGTAIAPTWLSSSSISFIAVAGEASAPKTVTLYNYQHTPLKITSITVPTYYAVSGGTCTSTVPLSLAASSSCTISITLTPPSVGALTGGLLTINTDASNTPNTASLSGTAIAPAWLSSSSISLVGVVGEASAPNTVTLYNNQLTPLGITSIAVPTSYAVSGTCPNPGTLPAGSSCTIIVTLTPPSVGSLPPGSLTVTTNAPVNGTQTASLSGTGIAPAWLSSSSISFAAVAGEASAPKTVTLYNNQLTPLSITSITASTPYAVSGGTCTSTVPLSLPAGSSCTISVTVTPPSVETLPAGTLTVTTNAPVNGTQTASLSGTAIVPVTLSPSIAGFGSIAVGTTSTAKTFTLTNYQPTALSITSAVFGGPFVLDTGAVTTCPVVGGVVSGTLAANSKCVIGVDFQPTAVGPAAGGQITVNDSAPLSPQVATLTGTGVVPVAVSPGTLAFGTVVADNAVTKNVILTNNQASSITINSITGFPAAYTQGIVANSCTPEVVVAPGGSCVIAVTLTATATGAQPGTIIVNDSALNSSQSFTVSANAVAPVVLTPSTLSQTYTGSPLSVTATTNPAGLTVNFTYTGTGTTSYGPLSAPPTNVGTYSVTGTISSAGHIGSATGTLAISPASATVTIGSQTHTYTGSAISATATTNPTGISVSFTYTGTGATIYGPSATAPTNAGTYSVTGTISNANYTGSGSGTLTISPASATVAIGSQSQTYTGSPITASATTTPTGLTVNFTYTGTSTTTYGPSATAPTNAGTYSVTGTISNANYNGTGSGTLTISPASATVAIGSQTQTYTGSAISATATTTPTGLTVNFTYTGTGTTTYGPSTTAPTNTGSYSVTGTVSNTNYTGTGSGTLTISPATATVAIGSQTQTYTGSPLAATATTTPTGLTVNFLYTGTGTTTYGPSASAPTNTGSYSVTGTISNANYTGMGSGTLTISPASATVAIGSQSQTYTGSPITASATTTPTGLTVNFTYTGTGTTTYGPSATAPTNAGTYSVTGTISNANYTGTGSGTLTISPATATVTIGSQTQTYTGSAISATATTTPTGLTVNFTYTGTGATNYGPSSAPTNVGTYSVNGAISNSNYNGTGSGTLTISPAAVNLSFTSIPLNETYGNAAFPVVASDVNGAVSGGLITYSATSGPASIGSTTGIVTLSGSGTVYLQASQAASGNYTAATATASFIVYPKLTLTAATLSSGVVGTPYSQSLVSLASGGNGSANYTWSTNAAGVSSLTAVGLTLNSNGTVTGTPTKTQNGTAIFQATVSDTAGNTFSAQMQVTINASLAVSTTTLPYGFTGPGDNYSQQLMAVGGTGTYTSWAMTSGGTQLAALGLSLNTATGVISNGSATLKAGSASITVTVTDSSGATALSTTLTINIYNPLAQSAASASVPGPAIYSQGYTGSINVVGGSGNFTWTVTGLPAAGFSYAPTTGSTLSISATTAPSTAQTINFTAYVTDNITHLYTSAIQYSIIVGPQTPLVLQPASLTALPSAITGESYTNSSISLSGGSLSGYVFTVNGGGVTTINSSSWTLPDGLSASSSNGVLTISGKPNSVSPITLGVSATDGAGDTVGPYYYSIALSNPTPLSLPAAGPLIDSVLLPVFETLMPSAMGNAVPLMSVVPFTVQV